MLSLRGGSTGAVWPDSPESRGDMDVVASAWTAPTIGVDYVTIRVEVQTNWPLPNISTLWCTQNLLAVALRCLRLGM